MYNTTHIHNKIKNKQVRIDNKPNTTFIGKITVTTLKAQIYRWAKSLRVFILLAELRNRVVSMVYENEN